MVSVIIPVYKVEEYLDRCMESVCNQSYSNLEIILVDDGSPDNCPKMCDAWAKKDCRVRVIHQENGGLSVARNSGLRESRGDYIIYIDSDDYIKTDMIEVLVAIIQKYSVDVAISTYYLSVDEDENSYRLSGEVLSGKTEDMVQCLFSNGLWQAWAKLIRREIAIKCPFVDRLIYEDYENTPRLLSYAKTIAISMDGRYIYTVREDSIMGARKKATCVDFAKITDSNLTLYEKQAYRKEIQEYLYAFLFKQLVYNYHTTIKSVTDDDNEFLSMSRNVIRNHRKKWMRAASIGIGRKVSYFFIAYMPQFYRIIYLLSHKEKP